MPVKKIAIIAGEESGDLLGADLVRVLKSQLSEGLSLIGVGGEHLQAEGLKSLIEPSEIALIGISAIVRRLPRLLGHVRNVATTIIDTKPDMLIIVDNPEFTHRIARKVRTALPHLPVINYVSPTVWGWRPERAKAMKAYITEVLCILPFEPAELTRLGGPTGTFVGHKLSNDHDILRVASARQTRTAQTGQLLLLPGSRTGEIMRLLPDMLLTAKQMLANGTAQSVVLPTFERHKARINELVKASGVPCSVVVGTEAKWSTFATADVALAASGTVTLELALANVPHAAVYRLDWLAKIFIVPLIVSWSASLPNLIANDVIVSEHYERQFRPGLHSRLLAGLAKLNSPAQIAQLAGFASVREALKTNRPAAEIAAERIMTYLK
jgi:lipid-A-disaccharide synthase